jgi:hypothetical protein
LVLLPGAFGEDNRFLRQKTYPFSSKMMEWNYLTEVPSSCGPEDDDFAAFVEATSPIGGRDVVEEFIACGLSPLGELFGF